MNNEDTIESLRAEADRLYKQLEHNYNELKLLYRKIEQLENRNRNISSSSSQLAPKKIVENWHLENFIGLKLIHLVGIVILVIGLSIGVKYAIDKNLISEGMRIVLAYTAGVVLYGLSVWLKRNYKSFSAILFSGAMAYLFYYLRCLCLLPTLFFCDRFCFHDCFNRLHRLRSYTIQSAGDCIIGVSRSLCHTFFN